MVKLKVVQLNKIDEEQINSRFSFMYQQNLWANALRAKNYCWKRFQSKSFKRASDHYYNTWDPYKEYKLNWSTCSKYVLLSA